MIAFRYRAIRDDGASVAGTVQAASESAAAGLVSARGLFPVAVTAAGRRPPWRKASLRQQAVAMRCLASLVAAGVPLEKALTTAATVTFGPLAAALASIRSEVREGAGLAAAMSRQHLGFDPVASGLVRAGERGGGLSLALERAATFLETRAETAGRVRAALAYPLLLAVVGSASVGFIVAFVVPRFAALLADVGQALPPATRALLATTALVREHAALAAGVPAALVAMLAYLATSHRAAVHESLLRWPLVGPIRHALASARVTRTLGTLLDTGAPALVALNVSQEAAGDDAVAARLRRTADQLAEGAAMSAALASTRAVTPLAYQLAAIGEASGQLGAMLVHAADIEEAQAQRRLQATVGLLEPLMIVGFALLVALVAGALLQAVYALRPA